MSHTINTFLTTQPADNHILFALLFFLNFEDEPRYFDIDAPISEIDEDTLVLAVVLLETILGIDVPDAYLTENKTRSLHQLAEEIRVLPKLPDKQFFKKLKVNILDWKAVSRRN